MRIEWNINFLELICTLSEKYKVFLITEEIYKKYQTFTKENIHYLFVKNMSEKANFSECNFSLVICVNEGLKLSKYIAKKENIPMALLSYEILFANEQNFSHKEKQIADCKDVSFAIAQDSMRAYLLSQENNIPMEKIMYMPVADCYKENYKRSNYLREKFSIPKNKKIALYIGSLSGRWTMKDALMQSVSNWPNDWVLVLHSRYGLSEKISKKFNGKIYISKEPVEKASMLENMLCSADCGITLYDIDITSKYLGKNILFMGQSSGKTATYLKYGLSILTNNMVSSSNIISDYNLGFRFNSLEELNPKCFDNVNMEQMKKRCIKYFRTYLDFSLYKKNFLKLIDAVILNKPVEYIIARNNAILPDTKNYNSMQLLNVFNGVYEQFSENIEYNRKLVKFALSNKNIFIYGAGYNGKEIAKMLMSYGVCINGFIVSDGEKKQNSLFGKPVYYFSESPFAAIDTGIIISIKDKSISQKIRRMLKKQKNPHLVPVRLLCKF